MVQDGFSPSCACAEDVSVREAAAGSKAGKLAKGDARGEEVRHVDVYRGEARSVEGEGHFTVPIDALFSENRYAGV